MRRSQPSPTRPSQYPAVAVEFSILGSIEAEGPGGRLDIGGPKERAALAVLAAWADEVVSTDRLVDALWGDEPPRTNGKLVQNLVLHLRKTLGRDLIETRPTGYVLRAGPDAIDARRFERLVTEGRQHAAAGAGASAVASFATALDLWRGSALPELAEWAPARAESTRLEELRRCAEEEQADAALAVGRHREWVTRLEALVANEPLRERRWALLMLALYRAGRQVDALRAYQRAREALQELGLEPGPELRAIERAIAAQDVSLVTAAGERIDVPSLPTGVVSFLLTDIEGSSALWDRAPKEMARALDRHDALIEHAVTAAGGVLLKARGEGDSTFSVFTKTSAAVAAALAAHAAISAEQWPDNAPIRARMAVHTGEAHERDGDYFGPTVNRAARLRSLAEGGQVLLSEAVATLVRDDLPEGWDLVELGEQTLRGHTRPERVFTLAASGAVVDHRATVVARSCPYMGLLPFQPHDDRVFFGRTELLATLFDRLERASFVAVVGASGSGKSSLLRAGLVAGLHRAQIPGSDEWLTVVVSPGTRPLAELAAHLGPLCGDSASDLLHDLEADPRALDVAIRQALVARPPGAKVVLAVDQLEELFTLCRDDDERRRFLGAVVDAASRADGPAVVVVALRADFFAHAATHAGFARLLERHTFLVGAMDDTELREVIEGPARVAGLALEPGLADLILRDVAGEPGNLPLLSHALLEVWGRREGRTLTIAGYHASGGVTGAVARTAESVYEAFDPDEQRVARGMFVRLTELGEGTEDTRRRVALDELSPAGSKEGSRVDRVLDVLVAARLVTISENAVEVSHEALIRNWPRLRTWLDDDREGLRIMRHVTHSARDWDERGRDDTELYRGPRLVAALEWRTGHDGELNALEHEFLEAGERVLDEETRARTRATRRLHALLVGTGIALVVALIAGALAVSQRNRANTARDHATAVANAETVRRLAVQSREAQSTSLDLSLLLAVEAHRREDSLETRGALQSALLSNPQLLGFLRGTSPSYWSVAISADGLIAGGGLDGKVDVWNAQDRRLIGSFTVGTEHVTVAFAPDRAMLAVISDSDHTLTLWDAKTQQPVGPALTSDMVTGHVSTIAFSPDGRELSAGVAPGEIATWDLATRAERAPRLRMDDGTRLISVAYSPNDRLLAVASDGGRLALFDPTTRSTTGPPLAPGPHNPCEKLAFDPASTRLAGGFSGERGYVWDIATGDLVPSPSLDAFTLWRVAFSPDGATLAAGTNVDSVEFVDANHLDEPAVSVPTQGGVVFDMAFSPDGTYVATANAAGSISIVEVGRQRKLARPLATAPLQWATFSPDSSVIAAPDWTDGSLSLLDAKTGTLLHRLEPPGMRPIQVLVTSNPVFSPDGKLIAYGGFTGQVAIFDVATGKLMRTLVLPPAETTHLYIDPSLVPSYVGALAFSPDGTRLVAAAFESATVFDVQTARPIGRVDGWQWVATHVQFSRDGTRFLVAGLLSPTVLFDSATLQRIGEPFGDTTTDSSFFGPVNTMIVTDASGHLRVIDIDTRAQVGPTIAGQPDQVSWIDLLPGDREVAVSFFSTPNGEAAVYDLASGQRIGVPIPSLGPYGLAATSPDGMELVSGDGTGMVAWDLNEADWAQIACAAAGRNLTPAEWSQYLPSGEPYRATCPGNPS